MATTVATTPVAADRSPNLPRSTPVAASTHLPTRPKQIRHGGPRSASSRIGAGRFSSRTKLELSLARPSRLTTARRGARLILRPAAEWLERAIWERRRRRAQRRRTAPSSNLKILTINNFSNRLVLKISIRRFPFLEKYYHKIVNSLEFMNMSDVKLWDKVIKIIKTNLIL